MKYINKLQHMNIASAIIDNVLENSWIEDQSQYINANYDDGLCNSQETFYDELTSILLQNQENYCCYCMKSIAQNETTLEHIIPHNTRTQGEFDRYLVMEELTANVTYKENFNRHIKLIPPPVYPHDIAYHNLVASCDSNSHCNHYRGSKYIKPLFYDTAIEAKVEYDNEGGAFCSEYLDELHATNISGNNDLIIFRKLWQELSTIKDTPDDVTDEDIELIALTLTGGKNYERILNNLYGNPSKKDELMKYKWFFHYYRQG